MIVTIFPPESVTTNWKRLEFLASLGRSMVTSSTPDGTLDIPVDMTVEVVWAVTSWSQRVPLAPLFYSV